MPEAREVNLDGALAIGMNDYHRIWLGPVGEGGWRTIVEEGVATPRFTECKLLGSASCKFTGETSPHPRRKHTIHPADLSHGVQALRVGGGLVLAVREDGPHDATYFGDISWFVNSPFVVFDVQEMLKALANRTLRIADLEGPLVMFTLPASKVLFHSQFLQVPPKFLVDAVGADEACTIANDLDRILSTARSAGRVLEYVGLEGYVGVSQMLTDHGLMALPMLEGEYRPKLAAKYAGEQNPRMRVFLRATKYRTV